MFQKPITHGFRDHKETYNHSRRKSGFGNDPNSERLLTAEGVDTGLSLLGGTIFDNVNSFILRLYFLRRNGTPEEQEMGQRYYQTVIDKRDDFLDEVSQFQLAELETKEDMKRLAKDVAKNYPKGEAASFHVWASLPDTPPPVPAGAAAAVANQWIPDEYFWNALIECGMANDNRAVIPRVAPNLNDYYKSPLDVFKYLFRPVLDNADAQKLADTYSFKRDEFLQGPFRKDPANPANPAAHTGKGFRYFVQDNGIQYSPYDQPSYGQYRSYQPYTPASQSMVPRSSYYY